MFIVLGVMGVGFLGVCLCGGAVLLPAIQQAREAARRSQSRNNLMQIGLALHNYHDTYTKFPASSFTEDGKPYHNWQPPLLPYLDQSPLYGRIDFNVPWDDAKNSQALSTPILTFTNVAIAMPSPVSHYTGNSQVLGKNLWLPFSEIHDGSSNTLLAGEINAAFPSWGDPKNTRDPANGPGNTPETFGSPFRNGSHVLMGDGAVKFISLDVDPSVWKAIATPKGGEIVNEF